MNQDQDPAAATPREHGDDAHQHTGGNARQLVAALIVLAILVGGGLWLSGTLRGASAIQDCVAAGRTNCAPIQQ